MVNDRPEVFCCPHCGNPLHLQARSLRCINGHSYDVAREGYVNLLRTRPDTIYESSALFSARRRTYEAGFWNGVTEVIAKAAHEARVLLDAGCGEGSLLKAVSAPIRIGLDIARPAAKLAAKLLPDAAVCVGDLCALPLKDQSVDVIVNLLTPAHYGEFIRVLKDGGLLLKVIPRANHLRQIRTLSGKADYTHDAEETLAVLQRRLKLIDRVPIRYDFECSQSLATDVYAMTPLTAHEEARKVNACVVTVDVELLIASAAKQ